MRERSMKYLLIVLIATLVLVSYHSYASYQRSAETMRAMNEITKHSCCDSPEKLVSKLRRVLRRDPDCLEARYMLAEAYDSVGDRNQEERQYRLAVRSAPGDAETHCRLGEFYLMQKRYGRAAAALTECLALDSEFPRARALLVPCYEKMGGKDAALRTWAEVLRREPHDEIAQRAVQRIRRGARD